MIVTQHAIIVTKHRWFVHFAPIVENTKADNVDMTPVGIESNDAWTDVNPKFFIMIPLKVVRPSQVSVPVFSIYGRLTSVRYVDCDVEEEDDPCFRIHQSLDRLIPFPLLVDDAGLILSQALHPVYFLSFGKEFGVHGCVWQEDKDKN